MMSGCVTTPRERRPRGRYEVVPDPLGWRIAYNGSVTSPFHRLADAARLAHRLQRQADALYHVADRPTGAVRTR